MIRRRTSLGIVAAMLAFVAAHADDEMTVCLPDGGGRLEMQISGEFETVVAWDNAGTQCEGGPRPTGEALRLMFSRDDDGLLVVLGITGLARGATGSGMLANLTIVRQGLGRFYGSLGADACIVEITEHSPVTASAGAWRVGGHGRCEAPIEAIAREGEIRVAPFVFTGKAYWPEEEG